ncbi:MAG: hypothetical protein J7513_09295 [Solirubrobacteraceae bacterium]|nr:hypothetical protein [Solirubrobacteraceae bacterium]
MADLPQIPGSSGPPQIPGGSDYSARSAGRRQPEQVTMPSLADGQTPIAWGDAAPKPKRKQGRRRRGKFRMVHLAIAAIIALIGLARSSSEVKTPKINLPEINVPDAPQIGNTDATGGSDATVVPAATVYRAGPGAVEASPSTIIELGMRNGKIRWVAARGFPIECSSGRKSSGLILYTDEGKASGSGGRLRYADKGGEILVRYRPDSRRGTFNYDRRGADERCTGSVDFRATRASGPALAQALLDADRRAAEAFGGD